MFSNIFTIVFCSFIVAATTSDFPSPMEYFSVNDASQITWAHRTNSKEALTKALEEDDIHMIEADVLMGTIDGTGDPIPIMAHPPDTESDLSLEEFIKEIKEHGKKGIKLDFKTMDAVDASLDIVATELTDVKIPLFLNADILAGPVNENIPKVSPEFLTKCKVKMPEATLSVGWTTNIPDDYEGKGTYADKYTTEMEEALKTKGITQPVTFPVRAALCHKPHDSLKGLVESGNHTLTVWSVAEDEDHISYNDLAELQVTVGKENAYFDMPEDQMKKFREASTTGSGTLNVATLSSIVLCLLIAVFL